MPNLVQDLVPDRVPDLASDLVPECNEASLVGDSLQAVWATALQMCKVQLGQKILKKTVQQLKLCFMNLQKIQQWIFIMLFQFMRQ